MATKKKPSSTRVKEELVDKEYFLTDAHIGNCVILKTGNSMKLSVYDSEKGYRRLIRHCPNEKSVFVDEQSEFALVEPIVIQSGHHVVPATQVMTQNFLDIHPDNVKNGGNWFYEQDDEIDAVEDVKDEELILDIKSTIRAKSREADGEFALEMAVSVLTGSINKASGMSANELKRHLYSAAERDPSRFSDINGNVTIFDDQEVMRRYITLRAIKDGIIAKSNNGRSMVWGDTKEVIVTAPQAVKLSDYFPEYLATDDGILVSEEIQKRS
ncbi:MAG: hypothetical protein HRU18_03605 [Pseudoalteromonas sp.]|uniref:hypothetical protein n=1 Tax=Pseudoalteromonas sp. TaxID=53249 RepID=UPI001D8FF124|nr:hypothetical protein [Pseudoalteromonas sp.]NRA77272.1 hypothetical protein [Pseudoalteromonas sp.]